MILANQEYNDALAQSGMSSGLSSVSVNAVNLQIAVNADVNVDLDVIVAVIVDS
jgi:hypothetical protein